MVEVYETLPIVPLRDVVVFPHMMMPFVIGRPSSIRALEHALGKDKRIFLAAQHDASTDDPKAEGRKARRAKEEEKNVSRWLRIRLNTTRRMFSSRSVPWNIPES